MAEHGPETAVPAPANIPMGLRLGGDCPARRSAPTAALYEHARLRVHHLRFWLPKKRRRRGRSRTPPRWPTRSLAPLRGGRRPHGLLGRWPAHLPPPRSSPRTRRDARGPGAPETDHRHLVHVLVTRAQSASPGVRRRRRPRCPAAHRERFAQASSWRPLVSSTVHGSTPSTAADIMDTAARLSMVGSHRASPGRVGPAASAEQGDEAQGAQHHQPATASHAYAVDAERLHASASRPRRW